MKFAAIVKCATMFCTYIVVVVASLATDSAYPAAAWNLKIGDPRTALRAARVLGKDDEPGPQPEPRPTP